MVSMLICILMSHCFLSGCVATKTSYAELIHRFHQLAISSTEIWSSQDTYAENVLQAKSARRLPEMRIRSVPRRNPLCIR
jgi:hypothetical protein